MKDINLMTHDELQSKLEDLRLTRKVGYEHKIRQSHKKSDLPDDLKGIDNNLAILILKELEKNKAA